MAAHTGVIFDLADAWDETPAERKFSIRSWLQDGTPKRVILQGNGEYSILAHALQKTVFGTLLSAIASAELSDSHERRRWIIGDEFLQLGKVKQMGALLQTARSKGIRFVLAAQDIPGVHAIYEADFGDSLLGAAGTLIATQSTCPKTQEWVSRRAGSRVVERSTTSTSYSKNGRTETVNWTESTVPVLSAQNVGSILGQFKVRGGYVTRAALIGSPRHVGVLDWPRVNRPAIAAASQPSLWTKGGRAHTKSVESEDQLAHNAVKPDPVRAEHSETSVHTDECSAQSTEEHLATVTRRFVVRRKINP